MYDSLEGLNYKPGECSNYVSIVLKNVSKSTENGDLIKVPSKEIKKGDVVVGGWSSQLVIDDDYFSRAVIPPQKAHRDENGIISDPLIMIIKDETLRRLQREHSLRKKDV